MHWVFLKWIECDSSRSFERVGRIAYVAKDSASFLHWTCLNLWASLLAGSSLAGLKRAEIDTLLLASIHLKIVSSSTSRSSSDWGSFSTFRCSACSSTPWLLSLLLLRLPSPVRLLMINEAQTATIYHADRWANLLRRLVLNETKTAASAGPTGLLVIDQAQTSLPTVTNHASFHYGLLVLNKTKATAADLSALHLNHGNVIGGRWAILFIIQLVLMKWASVCLLILHLLLLRDHLFIIIVVG